MKLQLKVPQAMVDAEAKLVAAPASALNFQGLAGAAQEEGKKLELKVPTTDMQTPPGPNGEIGGNMTAIEIDDLRQRILSGEKVPETELQKALTALRAGRFSFSTAVASKKADKAAGGIDLNALPEIA